MATLRSFLPLAVCVAALILVCADPAFAQGMPWERTLNRLITNLSGPTGWAFVILGIIWAAIRLVGGEHDALRGAFTMIIMGGIILNAPTVANWLFF